MSSVELRWLVGRASGVSGRGVIFEGAVAAAQASLLDEARELLAAGRPGWTATVHADAATASVPFGALWHLLPAAPPADASPSGLLRWAIDAIRHDVGGRPMVILIHQADLLDPLSAAMIYYLARCDAATVVATVRPGGGVPDPIRALWTEGLAVRANLDKPARGD